MPPWMPDLEVRTTTTATPNNWVYVTTTPGPTPGTAVAHVTTTQDTIDATGIRITNTGALTMQTDETCMEKEYEFQVGDVVRIKNRDKIPGHVYFGWDENMNQWCGQEFVIAEIKGDPDGPRLYFQDASEEMKGYWWGTDMVELVSSIESRQELSNEEINDWNTLMNQV